MTRERAIRWLKEDIDENGDEYLCEYIEAVEMAIEALEQEPILDKIRAEIDKARFVDKDTRICKNALASGLEVAMEIIDKYKAESEDKE